MRKIFFTMLLCGVIILGFTGCNKKENTEIKNPQIENEYIDNKIISELEDTKKIVIKDAINNLYIKDIYNPNDIKTIINATSKSVKLPDDVIVTSELNTWTLEMYDDNGKIIKKLKIWKSGYIGFGGKEYSMPVSELNSVIQIINSNRTIVVLLKHDVTSEDITRIKHEIEKIDSIENIVFKSKEDLKEEMMNSSDTFNAILSDRDDNPLVDEFIITLENIEKREEIVKLIKNIDMVDNIF